MRRFLLVVLASVTVAGCGAGVDASLLATAVQNTEEAGGAELVFQMEMEIPGLGEPVVMTGSGVEDAKGRRGQITFDMSALGQIPGAGALCANDGCEMEVVSDGLTVYMRSGLFAAGLGGKEWMKLDIERFSSSLGIPAGGMGEGVPSASQQLRMLRSVSGDVTDEGRQTLRGVETTHYSATVDMRRTVDTLPESQRELARKGIERLIEMTGQSEMPFDVWIDDDDRIRRLEFEQTMEQAGVEARMHMTAEYVRFGVPVEIDVPDDDDVFDATDLTLQQLER
jgi:predicted small secreted protein